MAFIKNVPLFWAISWVGLLFAIPVSAASASDPTATRILANSTAALAGNVTLSDVTLAAAVKYTSGSDEETGTATLKAKGDLESLVSLTLNNGPREEIRQNYSGVWSAHDLKQHAMAIQNCVTPASWFFPHFLIAAAQGAGYQSTYAGLEQRDSVSVHHVQISGTPGLGSASVFPQELSAVDLYIDATTFLPNAIAFNLHPDTTALRNMPVEIRFGSYQSAAGVQIPHLITKLFLNSVLLELTVTSAEVNTGLQDSVFDVPPQN